jgi:hypothetical protein
MIVRNDPEHLATGLHRIALWLRAATAEKKYKKRNNGPTVRHALPRPYVQRVTDWYGHWFHAPSVAEVMWQWTVQSFARDELPINPKAVRCDSQSFSAWGHVRLVAFSWSGVIDLGEKLTAALWGHVEKAPERIGKVASTVMLLRLRWRETHLGSPELPQLSVGLAENVENSFIPIFAVRNMVLSAHLRREFGRITKIISVIAIASR